MNLLFWNLYDKQNDRFIVDLLIENDIDTAIFAEYQKTDFLNVVSHLNGKYQLHDGVGGCTHITLLSKITNEVSVRREQDRYTLYSIACNDERYLVAGIHLPANPHSKADDRKNTIRDLVLDINEQEYLLKHDNTIVIGDFNASPYDSELILKDHFNAVLFKDIIKRAEHVKYNKHIYKRFYNPMVHYISETKQNYGSYFYGSGIDSLYWFCYDQVLVRRSLMDLLKDVKFCRMVNNSSLMTDTKPKKEISDHLPLVVTFERS